MTTNLMLGLVVFAVGFAVAVVQLVHLAREQRAHLGTGGSTREHVLSLVFLGVVPMLAGTLFIGAWWSGEGQEPGSGLPAFAAKNITPLR